MNSLDFLKAVGDIDDAFVYEVEELKKGRKAMRGIPFVMKGAACLLLLIGLALFWQSNRNYQHNMKSGEERGMDENTVNSEKESGEGHNSASSNWNHEMAADEIISKISEYIDNHELPDWFGDYYLENDTVYVLLVDNSEKNQNQVKDWAGSDNIVFKKADFSVNYLNGVIEKVYQGMASGKIDFIDLMMLDSQANRINIKTKRDISDKEQESLYVYDTQGAGSAFIISTSPHEVPETDGNTKNEQMPSPKPLAAANSQVTMTAKMKKDVLAIKIENKSNQKVFFGEEYTLYRKNNGKRERIEYLPNVGVHDIRYIVKKDETYTDEIKLSDVFGELASGEYVIEKEASLKGSIFVVSAEFVIDR